MSNVHPVRQCHECDEFKAVTAFPLASTSSPHRRWCEDCLDDYVEPEARDDVQLRLSVIDFVADELGDAAWALVETVARSRISAKRKARRIIKREPSLLYVLIVVNVLTDLTLAEVVAMFAAVDVKISRERIRQIEVLALRDWKWREIRLLWETGGE